MSELHKRYIAGPEGKLTELFPDYRGKDERILPDGNMLIEVNLTDLKLASMKSDNELLVMTHEEALEYVEKFQVAQDSTGRAPMVDKSSTADGQSKQASRGTSGAPGETRREKHHGPRTTD